MASGQTHVTVWHNQSRATSLKHELPGKRVQIACGRPELLHHRIKHLLPKPQKMSQSGYIASTSLHAGM